MYVSIMIILLHPLLILLLLLAPDDAWAKSSKEFEQHVAAADRYYDAKNYDQAIPELDAAYRLDPMPRLLINIGRCHYLADRPKEALDFYNKALRTGKLTRSERDEVTASIANATIKYQEQQQKKTQEEARRVATEHAALAAAIRSPPPKPPEKKPLYKSGWFWTAIGVGVVTIAGIAVLAARPWEKNEAPLPDATF